MDSREQKRQARKKKDEETGTGATKPKRHSHWASRQFERDYMRQYEVRQQEQIRRYSQEESIVINRSHGLPETASELTGPPKDTRQQVDAVFEKFAENQRAMKEIKLKTQVQPPPGETIPTTEPWNRIELTQAEVVLQSYRADMMRAALMRAAHERKEITDQEFEDFRKTGMLPPKAYELPDNR